MSSLNLPPTKRVVIRIAPVIRGIVEDMADGADVVVVGVGASARAEAGAVEG